MLDELKIRINNSLIETLPFYNINRGLTNFKTRTITSSIPQDIGKILEVEFDFEASFISQIKKELSYQIYKHINYNIRNNSKVDYINLIGYENRKSREFVSSYINGIGYKNIICSSKISSMMQDISCFIYSPYFTPMQVYLPDNLGKIGISNIWRDPYLNYNDDEIIMFNEVEVNFDVKNVSITNDIYTSMQRIAIDINLCVNNIDSTVVSIIENTDSPSYKEYISIRRDIKIDEIIK